MSYKRPSFRHPGAATNSIGFHKKDYEGALSTLGAGCGHDSISAAIIQACFELAIPPHRIAKISGIGCSSKAPTYFLSRSHGFNSVHGRMPSITTGAAIANRDLVYIGVSGDGDTASIGMGQFVHLLRRNVPMIYIIENNGVYGLTKGQFSATADLGSKAKSGVANDLPAIDVCAMAIELGCNFVARSFAGDPKQMIALLKAALGHRGTAMFDVISPCVTFNNHDGSTKSYKYAKDHEELLHEISYVPFFEQISLNLEWGAAVMGANRLQVFRRILLPLTLPGLLTAGILILVNTVSNFELTFLVSGGGSQTLVVALFYNVFAGGVRPVYSVDAMAMMYMAMVLVLLIIALRFVRPTQMVFRLDQPKR